MNQERLISESQFREEIENLKQAVGQIEKTSEEQELKLEDRDILIKSLKDYIKSSER